MALQRRLNSVFDVMYVKAGGGLRARRKSLEKPVEALLLEQSLTSGSASLTALDRSKFVVRGTLVHTRLLVRSLSYF